MGGPHPLFEFAAEADFRTFGGRKTGHEPVASDASKSYGRSALTKERNQSGLRRRDRPLERNQAAANGAPDRIRPVGGSEFSADRRHVELDRLVADGQPLRDSLVG